MPKKKEKEDSSGMQGMENLEEGVDKGGNAGDGDNSLNEELKKQKETIKKLESEKGELSEKTKELASIIDQISSKASEPAAAAQPAPASPPPNTGDIEKKLDEKVQEHFKDIKDLMGKFGTKLQEIEKSSSGPSKNAFKKIKEETSEKISSLEDTIKSLTEKMQAQDIPTKGGEAVGKGLAAFGETMDFHDELIEVKNEIRNLKEGLEELKEGTDSRVIRMRDQMKDLGKISGIEERLNTLTERLSTENIEKLKGLIVSSEDLLNRTIPSEIHKKMDMEMVPLYKNSERLKAGLNDMAKKMKSAESRQERLKEGFSKLSKAVVRMPELKNDREKLIEGFREKIERLGEKIDDHHKEIRDVEDSFEEFTKGIDEKVSELSTESFEKLKDKTEKNLIITKSQINDMIERISKFENYIKPTIEVIRDEMDKFDGRLKDIERRDNDLNDDIEEMIVSTFKDKFDSRINQIERNLERTKDTATDNIKTLDSRMSQFENVVNPSLKMFGNDLNKMETKVEKFKNNQEEFRDVLEKLRGDTDDMEKNVSLLLQLNSSVGNLEDKIGDLEGKMEDQRRAALSLKDQQDKDVKSISREISGVTKELESVRELSKGLEKEISSRKKLKEKVDKIDERLGDLKTNFSNVVATSLAERKDMVEDSREQKKVISEIVKELRGS